LITPHHARYFSSFPTRRSSDLLSQLPLHGYVPLVHERIAKIRSHAAELNRRRQRKNVDWETRRVGPCIEIRIQFEIAAIAVVQIDRKSTRLNSSHEWISYAVLC